VAPLIGHLMQQSRAGKHQKKRYQKERTERVRNGWNKKKGRDGENRLKIWLHQWMATRLEGFGGCELTIRRSMIGPWPLHRQVQSSNYLALIESDRPAIFSCSLSLSSVPFRISTFRCRPHSATNELNIRGIDLEI
jgi:hypothetical protein